MKCTFLEKDVEENNMCKKINVVNKVEKDLNVTINNVDGNIQIVIERTEDIN